MSMEQQDRELLTETRDIARDTARDVVALGGKVEELRQAFILHCSENKTKPWEARKMNLDILGKIAQWVGIGAAVGIAVLKK